MGRNKKSENYVWSWYKIMVLRTMLITFGIQVFEPRTIRTPPTVNAVQQLSLIPDQPGEMTVITGEWIYNRNLAIN